MDASLKCSHVQCGMTRTKRTGRRWELVEATSAKSKAGGFGKAGGPANNEASEDTATGQVTATGAVLHSQAHGKKERGDQDETNSTKLAQIL